jgi:hypothetical protein
MSKDLKIIIIVVGHAFITVMLIVLILFSHGGLLGW